MANSFVLLIIAISLSVTPAFAEEAVCNEDAVVHMSPDAASKPLGLLRKGSRIFLFPEDYGEWRALKVLAGGEETQGYIKKTVLAATGVARTPSASPTPTPAPSPAPAASSTNIYHLKRGLGFQLFAGHVQQDPSRIISEGFPILNVGALKGLGAGLGFFMDMPLNNEFVVRADISAQRIVQRGTVEVDAIGVDPASLETTQTFLSLGSTLKYYPNEEFEGFWVGTGLEVSKSLNASMTYSNLPVTVPSGDLPTYYFMRLGFGYDIPLKQDVFFLIEARGNFSVNSKPLLFHLDLLLGLSHSF